MWVYQQTGMPAHLPEAAQQLPTGEAVLLPQPQKHCRQNALHRKCLHRCRDITRKLGRKPAGCSSVPF